jgi:protein-disulfide isomerase
VPLLGQVLEQYPKQVKLVFKNFPLGGHKFAMTAAIAAMAAKKQGRFWEFHDKLFENQAKLDDNEVMDIARSIGLNEARFNSDRRDKAILSLINRDMQEGRAIGVRGTPTIFVNGVQLKNRSITGFRALIDRELEKRRDQSRSQSGGKTDSVRPNPSEK